MFFTGDPVQSIKPPPVLLLSAGRSRIAEDASDCVNGFAHAA